VLLQIENMFDMMTLTSGLTTNSYRRVSSGQASSCHSEPKGWGALRLYLFTLCIALCTTAHSDSHYSQLLPITLHDLHKEIKWQGPYDMKQTATARTNPGIRYSSPVESCI
jgi:hypothetical protein